MIEDAPLSPEAQAFLHAIERQADRPTTPQPDDMAAWATLQAEIERRTQPACAKTCIDAGVRLRSRQYGRLDTIIVTAPETRSDVAPLIYLHGGAYTGFSARSSLFSSVPIACQLGRPLFSIDYPLAPHETYKTIVPAAAAAIAEICDEVGTAIVIGDSAGGGLALSATLDLVTAKRPSPAMSVLISPWTDLSDRGESRATKAAQDPILRYDPDLRNASRAYAPGAVDHPGASPARAVYPDAFPPTLFLCGTQDILLSDSIDLHNKLRICGLETELVLFEGLFHSFPVIAPDLPESQKARAVIQEFVDRTLRSIG